MQKGPTNKVGSWSQSMWLLDQEPFEIRIAQLYDLETEFETIQDKSYELMDTFQMHWAIRGVATYLMTIEIMDLFYIKLQFDFKAFHLDPISFEVSEPDWLSGERKRIKELGLESCTGTYLNFLAAPTKFSLNLNFKRCETSLVDWITGKGEAGPGLHVYCFYEQNEEIELAEPLHLPGYVYKYAYAESCYKDYFSDWTDGVIDEDDPPYWDKYS